MARNDIPLDDLLPDRKPGKRRQGEDWVPSPNLIVVAIFVVIVVGVFLWGLGSSIDVVRPNEIAVIKNNLSDGEELMNRNGTVVHLPFGMTDVWRLPVEVQRVEMTRTQGRGDQFNIILARTPNDKIRCKHYP